MENDLKHLKMLLRAASSWNLYNINPVLFKAAVNDYRYYKAKFIQKHNKSPEIVEDGSNAQETWRFIKHPYEGKTKIGFKIKVNNHWYNNPWIKQK